MISSLAGIFSLILFIRYLFTSAEKRPVLSTSQQWMENGINNVNYKQPVREYCIGMYSIVSNGTFLLCSIDYVCKKMFLHTCLYQKTCNNEYYDKNVWKQYILYDINVLHSRLVITTTVEWKF